MLPVIDVTKNLEMEREIFMDYLRGPYIREARKSKEGDRKIEAVQVMCPEDLQRVMSLGEQLTSRSWKVKQMEPV